MFELRLHRPFWPNIWTFDDRRHIFAFDAIWWACPFMHATHEFQSDAIWLDCARAAMLMNVRCLLFSNNSSVRRHRCTHKCVNTGCVVPCFYHLLCDYLFRLHLETQIEAPLRTKSPNINIVHEAKVNFQYTGILRESRWELDPYLSSSGAPSGHPQSLWWLCCRWLSAADSTISLSLR